MCRATFRRGAYSLAQQAGKTQYTGDCSSCPTPTRFTIADLVGGFYYIHSSAGSTRSAHLCARRRERPGRNQFRR